MAIFIKNSRFYILFLRNCYNKNDKEGVFMNVFYNLINVLKTQDNPAGIPLWHLLFSCVFLLFFSALIINAMFISKKTFGIVFVALLFVIGGLISLYAIKPKYFETEPLKTFKIIVIVLIFAVIPFMVLFLIRSEIGRQFDLLMQTKIRRTHEVTLASSKTKEIIADAAFYLSSKKIGALMTIEKYTSLEQFSEKAIQMNADLSVEILTNIFIPNTPLHDGAVIIKNEKIICAGAYFTLSKNISYEKTTGSRHRAAIGVSEISDALSVVVSEETGNVSITYGSVLLPVADKASLISYLDSFSN